jgi:hypothetical protein
MTRLTAVQHRQEVAAVSGFVPASELLSQRPAPAYERCAMCNHELDTRVGNYFRDVNGRVICNFCSRRILLRQGYSFVPPGFYGGRP